MIYNPEFDDLMKYYRRPFFFHAKESYENVKELNTGKEILLVERYKFQESKKSVNDLFSEEEQAQSSAKKASKVEEEAKPAFSLKQRIAAKQAKK